MNGSCQFKNSFKWKKKKTILNYIIHAIIPFICIVIELFSFTCPKVDESVAVAHPRYADPEDCQYFYVCINGEEPRRNGCKLGQAFDDVSKRCGNYQFYFQRHCYSSCICYNSSKYSFFLFQYCRFPWVDWARKIPEW